MRKNLWECVLVWRLWKPLIWSCWISVASSDGLTCITAWFLINQASWVCTSHRLVRCVHVCVFSPSLSLSLSLTCSLSLAHSLSLAVSLFSRHFGGTYVCYFFHSRPCLFGRTYQRRLVGASLPLPAYLPVWSGLIWSGQMPADSLVLFFFLSLFFVMTSMDGLYFSLPFHQYYKPLPLPLFVPPCSTRLMFGAPHHSPETPQAAPCLCSYINVWRTDGWDKSGTRRDALCIWHQLEWGEWIRNERRRRRGVNEGQRNRGRKGKRF